ncbi:helix-turn-helix domain-containing protein [Mycobacterium sp. M23085]|uniref:helix-turn-helix domain-containing protein n=1 Tax=Mycobacterium sp. M23085 TaxID=3378087 RepID=UPI00387804C3
MARRKHSSDELMTLDEVASKHLPAGLKDATRWLANKVRSREIPAVKVGRTWYMADDHVEAMFDRLSNQHGAEAELAQPVPQPEPQTTPAASIVDGLSERSRRRLRSV